MTSINANNGTYCFLDLDIDGYRAKLATAAAFVDATDSRYGFSSKDLRHLGGSEVSRIPELISTDHEWASKNTECGGIATKPPTSGQRVVVRLFWDVAPLACENFATLCANGSTSLLGQSGKAKPAPVGESGKALTYRGSSVHRVMPGFVLQGGDFVFGNGSGGESVFGKKFKDERPGLLRKHDRRGILSMGNSGKNSNSSQFFLTFDKAPQCDGKHVIFGELVSGMEVLDAAETVGTADGPPSVPITISDCGILLPLQSPACGYWYDTPDPDSFSGISPAFMVRPRVLVVAPTDAVSQKFAVAMGTTISIVASFCGKEISKHAASIADLLSKFAADVVVVAPASKSVIPTIELPKTWEGSDIAIDEVVLEAKPVEALSMVRSNSWLSKRTQWQLDGNS